MTRQRCALSLLLFISILTGCGAPPPSGARPASDGAAGAPRTPTRIAVGVLGSPPTLWDDLNPGLVPGAPLMKLFVTSGLSGEDERRRLRPQLAESLPSTDNGSWVVFPDGRMETTWRLRPGALWHDGTPFTAADLQFAARVAQERDIEVFAAAPLQSVDRIESPDPTTVTVYWKQPYSRADAMFAAGTKGSGPFAAPLPRHILEGPLQENKAGFLQLPYWSSEFVGTGPYKLREWSQGSYALLDAFDGYVLGRPKIDQVEIRFIGDSTTMVANALAGAIDLTPWRGVTLDQGLQVREQWANGRVVPYPYGWTMMYPQLRAPSPAVAGDPQFRRALMRAMDRQELAETLTGGFGGVADSIIGPSDAEYAAVESRIVRYPYDVAAAARGVEALGFHKGADGLFQDQRGERLSIEIRTTANDANQKALAAVADYWSRAGIATDQLVIPNQLLQDTEFRSTYPGVELVNQTSGANGLENLLHSAGAPLPERNYRAPNSGKNRGAYMDPAYDALMDRYLVTVSERERNEVIGQLLNVQTDLVLVMGLFYSADAVLIANRLQNAPPGSAWNAYEWEVR